MKIGDVVETKYRGAWTPCRVIDVSPTRVRVEYVTTSSGRGMFSVTTRQPWKKQAEVRPSNAKLGSQSQEFLKALVS